MSEPSTNPYDVDTVRCAGPGCDQIRKQTNHWFSIVIGSDGSFVCWPFDKIALLPEMKPVCGAACAQKVFQQFLDKR